MQEILRNNKIWVNSLGVILLVAIIWFFGIKTPAYSVSVDGNREFVVENSGEVTQALEQLRSEEQNANAMKMEIRNRVGFKRVFVSRSQLVPSEKVAEELKLALQPKTMAVAILVNGKPIVYVQDQAVAEAMLKQLKTNNSQLGAGEKLLSLDFEEQVEVRAEKVSSARVLAWNDAWNVITIGTASPQKYIVQEGDSLWSIARKNDMYVADILQNNNLQENNLLSLGQQIIINKTQPLINVIAKVEGRGNEVIPYQTKTITDQQVSSGVKVRDEGQNGEKFVAYTAVKRNGIMDKRDVSEEKIIKEAVDKVVVKGSRTYQVASRGGGSSGNLDWPIYGSITQSFGGGHTGIDIGGSSGTTIVAAGDGTVSSASYQGGYGNFVVINHGNGLVTRYAHCSSLMVKAGQHVSQGEAIATRGSTGHSTGPHLHFEVLQSGAFRNPINYLR
ncbi:MAG: peptidoglycan DD-metalloendopeptidase family protein [Syntrophomonas sp.]|nr:peptidoglycan DD-metalloendopeptidase family protein [Syntrophomonas sp.]